MPAPPAMPPVAISCSRPGQWLGLARTAASSVGLDRRLHRRARRRDAPDLGTGAQWHAYRNPPLERGLRCDDLQWRRSEPYRGQPSYTPLAAKEWCARRTLPTAAVAPRRQIFPASTLPSRQSCTTLNGPETDAVIGVVLCPCVVGPAWPVMNAQPCARPARHNNCLLYTSRCV